MRQRRFTAAVAMLVGASMLSACGGSSSADEKQTEVATNLLAMPAVDDSDGLTIDGEKIADKDLLDAARKDTVVWYTGSGSESADITVKRFTAETGVKIEMTRLPSAQLAERVLSENGAGRLKAGVVTVTDPLIGQDFADKGVFTPYAVSEMDALKGQKDVVWQNGAYYTSYYSAYSFAYNSKLVTGKDVPTKWADLLDPKWKGKMGIVTAASGGTVQGLAYFQRDKFGPQYWKKLAALKPRLYDTTTVQLDNMARGEITIGTAGFNSTYGAELTGSPVKMVVPEDGISGTYNMQGLTKPGQDSPAAKLFMDWTMSKAGQRFAAAQGFVAARSDIPPTPAGDYKLPLADDPSFVRYTPATAEKHGTEVVQSWNKQFGVGN